MAKSRLSCGPLTQAWPSTQTPGEWGRKSVCASLMNGARPFRHSYEYTLALALALTFTFTLIFV